VAVCAVARRDRERQIALATGEFRTGGYVRDLETVSTCRWRRADA